MMTTATITPATAGAELLAELRQLLDRHDDASTLDEVRELADEVTAVLRRTRGRLSRLARKAAPPESSAETKESPKPAEREGEAAARDSNPKPVPLSAAPGAPRRRPSLAVALAVLLTAIVVGARRTLALVRRAAAALTRRRTAAVSKAAPVAPPPVSPEPVPPAPADTMTAVPDLPIERATGLACVECGTDFWSTRTLKMPVGVSESTGDTVFACVGECARRAGHREADGEQLELLS